MIIMKNDEIITVAFVRRGDIWFAQIPGEKEVAADGLGDLLKCLNKNDGMVTLQFGSRYFGIAPFIAKQNGTAEGNASYRLYGAPVGDINLGSLSGSAFDSFPPSLFICQVQ